MKYTKKDIEILEDIKNNLIRTDMCTHVCIECPIYKYCRTKCDTTKNLIQYIDNLILKEKIKLLK